MRLWQKQVGGVRFYKKPTSNKYSKIVVEKGFPKGLENFLRKRIEQLNKDFGFYPDVEFINDINVHKKASSKAAGDYNGKTGNIRVGTFKMGDMGLVIDHEYGHQFYVRDKLDKSVLKQYKDLVKLNPGQQKWKDKLNEALSYNKEWAKNKKWVRLREIYDEVKKNPAMKQSYAIKGGLKEFAAEMFAQVYPYKEKYTGDKLYKEAYDIIVTLPKKKTK